MIFTGFLGIGIWITDVLLVLGTLALTVIARRLQQPYLALVALLPVTAAVIRAVRRSRESSMNFSVSAIRVSICDVCPSR